MMTRFHLFTLLAMVSFSTIVAGCASFPSHQLPRYEYGQFVSASPRPSVNYDVRFLSIGQPNQAAQDVLTKRIDSTFSRAQVFSSHAPGTGPADYHLSFEMRNDGNVAAATVLGFISGMTLTVVPAYAKDKYTLLVDVKKGEQILKHYEYRENLNTWIQLFLVVLTPFKSPAKEANRLFDNMVLNLLADMQKDEIILRQ